MVLTQPDAKLLKLIVKDCFHTTMVLTQLETDDTVQIGEWKFPYHYGSYATGTSSGRDTHANTFPYHYGSYATGYFHCEDPMYLRFHTTMVLTQPVILVLVLW